MTLAELQRGIERLPSSRRKTELSIWVQQLEHGLVLITRNVADFAQAPIVLINPWAE